MVSVVHLLSRLAPTSVTITILGETGTGKDVLARAIHDESLRRNAPFVVFDCGAVAQNLAESELFGHERGAFTGAVAAHVGAFERAHGGTLFLDEIGELPLELQPRLLRVLENRHVQRVGGSQRRTVDVRVIAATNRDLRCEVNGHRFREDLYFRLAGAFVSVPNLRDRLEDLDALVTALLDDLGSPHVEVAADAQAVLRDHHWPGNVRELKNALSCALAFLDGDVLEAHHLRLRPACENPLGQLSGLQLGGQPLHRIECAAIHQTLALTQGNKARAAEVLGIALSTLYEKVKKYGLA